MFNFTGFDLLSKLGTFISKYYTQRDVSLGICASAEEMQSQFTQNLNDAKKLLDFGNIPVAHTENYYEFDLRDRSEYVLASPDVKVGASFLFDENITAGATASFVGGQVVDIFQLQDKIVNPKTFYKKGVDFQLINGYIVFHPNLRDSVPEKLWGNQVQFLTNSVFNSIGFILTGNAKINTEEVKHLAKLYINMMQFGMTPAYLKTFLNIYFEHPYAKTQGEVVQRTFTGTVETDQNTYELDGIEPDVQPGDVLNLLAPIFQTVLLRDAENSDYIVKDKEVLKREFETLPNTFGSGITFEMGVQFGAQYHIEDKYATATKNSVIYNAEVIYNPTFLSLKYLEKLIDATPPWVNLTILPRVELQEILTIDDVSTTSYDGVVLQEFYNNFEDGKYKIAEFGDGLEFGTFTFAETIESPFVKIIGQYHD